MYWPLIRTLIRLWLPLAVGLTVLAGLVYAAVQQDLRQSANGPQVQMAEDAAAMLARGQSPQAVAGFSAVDVAVSLAPFVAVFDADGQPLASSGRIAGALPTLPLGVAGYMRDHSQDRITWQPRSGLRIAAVLQGVAPPGGGFVLAGRSLREVETRETAVLQVVAVAWSVGMAGTLAIVVVGWFLTERSLPRRWRSSGGASQ